jgi:hypothetical protein
MQQRRVDQAENRRRRSDPKAIVRIAMAEKPGDFANMRSA